MKEQKMNQPYSRSLKLLVSAEPRRSFTFRVNTKESTHVRGDLKACKQAVREVRRKYDHQIDRLVRELAQQEQMPLEFPPLLRKNSYHNYRILSERPQQQQNSPSSGSHNFSIERQKRIRTESKEYQLSKERDGVYAIMKHYRQGSLKKMDLHLNMHKLKKWHDHHRNLVQQREIMAYHPSKRPFHQLQLH